MRIFRTAISVALAAMLTLSLSPALADTITFVYGFSRSSQAEQVGRQLVRETHQAPKIDLINTDMRSIELLEMVRYGKFELGLFSKADLRQIEALGVFDLPFLVKDRDQVRRVVNGPARKIFEDAFREQGLELLAILDGSFKMVAMTGKIESVAELKGMRFRPLDRNSAAFFSYFGASEMKVPSAEIYPALKSGVLDAFETTPEVMELFRFTEVSNGLFLTRHLYDPLWLVGSRDRLNSLPQGEADALRAAARRIEDASFAGGKAAEQQVLSDIGAQGVALLDLDPSERQSMVEAGRRFYDDYVTRVDGGANLLRHFLQQTWD